MLLGLRTQIYHAPDLEAAKAFYSKLTGLEPYFEAPFYIGFDINGCELGLDPDVENIAVGNNQVSYWRVHDINKALDFALEVGATIDQPINSVGENLWVAIVLDPWQNRIGLIQEGI